MTKLWACDQGQIGLNGGGVGQLEGRANFAIF